jgi:hypothetical protein
MHKPASWFCVVFMEIMTIMMLANLKMLERMPCLWPIKRIAQPIQFFILDKQAPQQEETFSKCASLHKSIFIKKTKL